MGTIQDIESRIEKYRSGPANGRVLAIGELAALIAAAKASGRNVGLCHGCFDVLHVGHLRHFEAARRICDILVVTVTADAYVNKGPGRPVFPAEERAELVAGLAAVDFSAISHAATAVPLIAQLQPSFFIKGQEYETKAAEVNPNFFLERDAIEKVGGCVKFTYEWTSSSTAAIRRIRNKV